MACERNVRMPCGRAAFCGRGTCPQVTVCVERSAQNADNRRDTRAECIQQGQPPKRELATPADIVFLYDGSLAGVYCCVHECVYSGQIPAAIYCENDAQPTLYQMRLIATNGEKAARVEASIPKKISNDAKILVETAFLSCLPQKELAILRFLLRGYQEGARTTQLFGHPDVKPILDAAKHMGGEVHLLKGFIRFSDYEGVLAATITPKNFVLPFLAGHFAARYSQEKFLIYDKTNKAALVCEGGRTQIVPMEGIEFPKACEKEESFRVLWRHYYRTVGIAARENPLCRMTNMPKRYWENMTEMQEYL